MNELRCTNCFHKLAEYSIHGSLMIEMKCPKCSSLIELRITGNTKEEVLEREKIEAHKEAEVNCTKTTFDAKEAAKYLGMSNWSLYELVKRKGIKHNRIGSRIIFRKEYLDEWLQTSQVVKD